MAEGLLQSTKGRRARYHPPPRIRSAYSCTNARHGQDSTYHTRDLPIRGSSHCYWQSVQTRRLRRNPPGRVCLPSLLPRFHQRVVGGLKSHDGGDAVQRVRWDVLHLTLADCRKKSNGHPHSRERSRNSALGRSFQPARARGSGSQALSPFSFGLDATRPSPPGYPPATTVP